MSLAQADAQILATIQERGFAVVPGLLDDQTIATMKEALERAAVEDLAGPGRAAIPGRVDGAQP